MELISVTQDNYFTDTGHMSVSKFKKFLKCEVDGLKEWGEPTPSMLVGSYVDAFVEGTLDKFIEEHPQIISSRGKTKGQLKSEFKQADEIIEFIRNDSILQDFLSGEKQVIMTGRISNIPFKIMMDSYSKGIAINDLKIMRSITDSNGEYYDFISQWGYDIQLAVYQEIVFQNTGEQLPCYIVAVTKETPINSAIINIPQSILDNALYKVKDNIERFYEVFKGEVEPIGCGKCKSCIENRKETPIISMDYIIQRGINND